MLTVALDLAVGALCIAWGMGERELGVILRNVCDKKRWVFEYGLCLKSSRSGMLGVG